MILVLAVARRNTRSVVAHKAYPFNGKELTLAGLNLQAVIDIKNLPSKIERQLAAVSTNFSRYNQVVIIGHGGRELWQKIQESKITSDDPIDDYSKLHANEYFKKRFSDGDYEVVFPCSSQAPINLQALGKLVGWHNESPLRIGINKQWGSWFAYRAIVLVKSNYLIETIKTAQPPCHTCTSKACITECPANALIDNKLVLEKCRSYRLQEKSKCKDRCLARMKCPVAYENQYQLEQINYHYLNSYQYIKL